MKKMILLASCLSLGACGYVSPNAGEEAVLVSKPWFFGSGGVADEPVKTGATIVAASTDSVVVNVNPIAFDIPFDDIIPSNGIPLDFHTVVRAQVTDSVDLVKNWSGGARNEKGEESLSWFWNNINPQYTNLVRQEVRAYTMESLAFNGRAIDQIDRRVEAKLRKFITDNKIPVRLLSVTIGRATPPANIIAQRTETAAQQQRKLTMESRQQAEVARMGAEQARANADNAYRTSMGLSPEQYVQLEAIKMQREVCRTSTCIFGGATPLIQR